MTDVIIQHLITEQKGLSSIIFTLLLLEFAYLGPFSLILMLVFPWKGNHEKFCIPVRIKCRDLVKKIAIYRHRLAVSTGSRLG